MTLIDAREMKPIRQACKNRLKKGAVKGQPDYVVATEHLKSLSSLLTDGLD